MTTNTVIGLEIKGVCCKLNDFSDMESALD